MRTFLKVLIIAIIILAALAWVALGLLAGLQGGHV